MTGQPAITLGPACEVLEGQARGYCVDDDRDTLFVIRHQGGLHGWINSCPHHPGAPLAWQRHAYRDEQGMIVCFGHGARFAPDTGVCVAGPCVGQSLQRAQLSVDQEQRLIWLRHQR